MNNDLISRSALLEAIPKAEVFLSHEVRRLICNFPGIEVIQCKDCTLYGPSPYGHPTIGWCKMHGTHYKSEFFCGLAERKEEKG